MGNNWSSEVLPDYPECDPSKFPFSDGKTITLSDRRSLGYMLYTCPREKERDLTTLHPVLLFPGLPGSRLFSHPLMNDSSTSLGIRLYVLERPGLGLSTPKPNRTFLDWATDVAEFIELMNLDRVSIIAYSAGGPFGLACAYAIPHLIHRIAIISSVSPRQAPHVLDDMPLIFKTSWLLTKYCPSVLRWIVHSDIKRFMSDPIAANREDVKLNCQEDQELMKRPEIETMFVRSTLELYSRSQTGTIADEYTLWGSDWGFDLAHIRMRQNMRVYHGSLDTGTTLPMGKFIAEQTGTQLITSPTHGHLYYFDVFEEVVEWMTNLDS